MEESTKEKILVLYRQGVSYNKIKEAVGCSKALVSYYCRKNKGKPNKYSADKIKLYQEYYDQGHSMKDVDREFGTQKSTLMKYLQQRNNLSAEEVRIRAISIKKKYKTRVKEQAVEYKGGCCILCGYNRCIKSLDFHHLNPDEKEFTISGGTKSFETIKTELDKCIMVCKNCHTEIHAGMYRDIYPHPDKV